MVLTIVAQCPGRPRGDHCGLEAGANFAYGAVSDSVSGGGMAGPYGAYFSAIQNGADALLTYYGCKKGNSDNCEGGNGPKNQQAYDSYEDALEAAARAPGMKGEWVVVKTELKYGSNTNLTGPKGEP
jgi:hypothetical protein